jgi:hypothetical protein
MHSLISPRRLVLACVLASALILPAVAQAHSVTAELRVVAGSKTLADVRQSTFPATVKTDPKATCFGADNGGSGKRVQIPNNTALGLLADALRTVSTLRPLSITDAFTFGLGVCGIGGHVAHGDGFWDLRRNHVDSKRAGDKLKVHDGDHVLWYLSPSFPPGDELVLKVPRRAKPDTKVAATVYGYDLKGKRSPVAGAKVSHAAKPTNASGRTAVVFSSKGKFHVRATHSGDIPSKVKVVTVRG